MKRNGKLIGIGLFLVLMVFLLANQVALCAESKTAVNLNHKKAVLYYFKLANITPADEEYLAYCRDYNYEIYNKYFDDEFEWQDQFTKIKKDFDAQIAAIDLAANSFVLYTRGELGRYDFTKEGFPCKPLQAASYFSLTPNNQSKYGYDTLFKMRRVDIFYSNPEDYNFLPYPQDAGKSFNQLRKDNSGNIDRTVFVAIHYNLLALNSDGYTKITDMFDPESHESYFLVGKINKIEVFPDEKSSKAMGTLIYK